LAAVWGSAPYGDMPASPPWEVAALPTGDTLQLGGDFIVDSEGQVAYATRRRPDDRPAVDELLAVLRAIR